MERLLTITITWKRFLATCYLIAPVVLLLAGCASSNEIAAAAKEATKEAKDTEASLLE